MKCAGMAFFHVADYYGSVGMTKPPTYRIVYGWLKLGLPVEVQADESSPPPLHQVAWSLVSLSAVFSNNFIYLFDLYPAYLVYVTTLNGFQYIGWNKSGSIC